MRVLVIELKKLFSGKVFLLIIAAVFTLNAYLMFRTANSGEAVSTDYQKIYDVLDEMTDEEKLDWLDEQLSDFSQATQYKWTAMAELRDECESVLTYKDFLESIDSQAKSMTSISIFAKPDTFNYRSILKTPPAYKNVQDVVPGFDRSQGIILATDNSFTDILCGFIVLFAVLSVMLSDREQGMSGLLFSLKRGRGYLLLTKLATLGVTVFLAVLLLCAENIFISSYLYGLGDLSRPIQSLSGFIGCNLKINIWQYLILYVLFKFIAIFCIGVVLSLIAVNTKNTVSFYGISATILVIEGVLYALIHPLSIYSVFHYINIIAFTKVNEIFCNYKNINFFEYPVPLIPTSISALLIFTLVGGGLSAYIYSKKRNLEFRKIGLKMKYGRSNKVHSQIWYTLYKSLILQKGALVIALFIAVAGFMSHNFMKKYDPSDVYYQYYTEKTKGPINADTIEFFENESARFSDLQSQLNEIQQNEPNNYTKMNELSKQLAPNMGFVPAYERLQQIKNIDGAYMFYDTGYKRAFGKAGYDDDMKYALAAVLLLVFLVSPLIANDNKYKMSFIISSTTSGKRSYLRRNVLAVAIYGLLAALLWIVPYSVTVSQYYGHSGLGGSLRSITDFISLPVNMKVWQYLLLVAVLRTLFVILSALVMLWVSSRCRNTTAAVLINFAIFALPIIIYLLGAKAMVNVGFCPLLSVNAISNNTSMVNIVILTSFIGVLFFITMRNKEYKNEKNR
ncbi:hypothetical protein [Ruminococcus flavefaciens]|uniref:ABC-2 family transporter protein n=1 Tax=Ruminococcus flavefaciens TaxID=1265 RepID=A0A315XT03_RUMFL|nr:hypothetical protein [Ruminococcus flavefaciens]PWJ09864.1 hypothetical protein IE37_03298 [Ruminococcus flavefaciens]SSA52155.1 hypothetical protein SAMN02910325_03298 [Ruminococcus flavefaciens]